MTTMRWTMPPPPWWIPGDEHPNTSSPRWRPWFSAENRCLVPANSFAEYARSRTDNEENRRGLIRPFCAAFRRP